MSLPSRAAFTLVELLIVISIIAVLVAMALPAAGKARDAAKYAACSSCLHQTHIASFNYSVDSGDRMPGNPIYSSTNIALAGTVLDASTGLFAGSYFYNAPQAFGMMTFLQDYARSPVVRTGANLNFTTYRNSMLHCTASPLRFGTGTPLSTTTTIDYMIPGWGALGWPYWLTPGAYGGWGTSGHIAASRYSTMGQYNGVAFKTIFAIDLYNHPDGGNVALPDGAVQRFQYSNAFRARTASAYMNSNITHGSFMIPQGYTFPLAVSRLGNLDANPISSVWFWNPDTTAGTFAASAPLQASPQTVTAFGISGWGK